MQMSVVLAAGSFVCWCSSNYAFHSFVMSFLFLADAWYYLLLGHFLFVWGMLSVVVWAPGRLYLRLILPRIHIDLPLLVCLNTIYQYSIVYGSMLKKKKKKSQKWQKREFFYYWTISEQQVTHNHIYNFNHNSSNQCWKHNRVAGGPSFWWSTTLFHPNTSQD